MRWGLLIGLSAATLVAALALLFAARTNPPPADLPAVAAATPEAAAQETPAAGLDAVVTEAVTARVRGDEEALAACVERLRRDRPEAQRLIEDRARRAGTAREMRLLDEIAAEVGR